MKLDELYLKADDFGKKIGEILSPSEDDHYFIQVFDSRAKATAFAKYIGIGYAESNGDNHYWVVESSQLVQ